MNSTDPSGAVTSDGSALRLAKRDTVESGTNIARRSGPAPKTVYHYTNAQGLMGIQREQCFWATNARFLNDENELLWSSKIFDNVISQIEANSKDEEKLLLRMSDAATLLGSGLEVFCCSFSEQPDDLNQWRGYAGDASPYSIGIRTGRIMAGMPSSELMSVIYDEAEQHDIATKVVELTVNLFRSFSDNATELEPVMLLHECLQAFREMSSYSSVRFKSHHWKSEQEWRLVSVLSGPSQLKENMKFRPGRFGVIPYLEQRMSAGGITQLPITEIVVGPTPLRAASVEATRMYFAQQDMQPPAISASTVPIR